MVAIVLQQKDHCCRIAGFSVREILVVAGIIVVLLALMIPVLDAAH
jgi:competence protein ComGC